MIYIRENFRYLSMPHYEAGSTDWAETAATAMLEQGKGNCYCFTALFTYCARQLGYQAYNVAGHEYSPDNDHAWTMIDWPDGETYLFDVQLEYAYLYQYENRPVIDMFKASAATESTTGLCTISRRWIYRDETESGCRAEGSLQISNGCKGASPEREGSP